MLISVFCSLKRIFSAALIQFSFFLVICIHVLPKRRQYTLTKQGKPSALTADRVRVSFFWLGFILEFLEQFEYLHLHLITHFLHINRNSKTLDLSGQYDPIRLKHGPPSLMNSRLIKRKKVTVWFPSAITETCSLGPGKMKLFEACISRDELD